jgi:hypothetical protein
LGHAPVNAGHTGQREVFTYDTFGYLEDAPNFVEAQVGLQVQAMRILVFDAW